MDKENQFSCYMCFPDCEDVGMLSKEWGFGIMKWEDKYHIVFGQGHDKLHTFENTPILEPSEDAEAEEVFNWWERHDDEAEEMKLNLNISYHIVKVCEERGYNPEEHGYNIFCFLYEETAKIINDYEASLQI